MAKTTPRINIDAKPREILSAYVNAPFDVGKQALEEKDYHIISLEENAKLRIQEGKNVHVSKNGNWVQEDVIYVPKKGIFLTKSSPIMENAKEATDCHRNNQDFYLTNEQVKSSLADCVELTKEPILTTEFANNPITIYAFGDSAKAYWDFLKYTGIKKMSIWTADMQDKAFARKLWFGGLDDGGFGLDGLSRTLNYDYWVRGVLKSAEGTQKI